MSEKDWWEEVEEKMRAYQRADPENLPGAVFAVETPRSGRLVSSVGDGWNKDSICAIASMTKPFTATALLVALEERGLLDVEMPVFELPGMGLYSRDEMKRRIRVRHLLQHTSGLPSFQHYKRSPATPCNDPEGGPPGCVDEVVDLGPISEWIGDPGQTNECVWARGRCRPARAASLEEVSEYVMSSYGPMMEPGSRFWFSCFNYVIAGRIIEELSGESMNRYLKRKVFEPLGMEDTFFVAEQSGDEQVDGRMSEGVTPAQRLRIPEVTLITAQGEYPPEIAPGPNGRWDRLRRGWRYIYPDGGMYSTAEDLLKYLGMLRDGGESGGRRVVSKEIVRLLVEDQGFGHTMGFGYRSDASPYGQGAGTLEHLGRFMTYFWFDNKQDDPLLGVFLSQRLTYLNVQPKAGEGLKVIYTHFVSLVQSSIRGFKPLQVA